MRRVMRPREPRRREIVASLTNRLKTLNTMTYRKYKPLIHREPSQRPQTQRLYMSCLFSREYPC